MNLHRLLKCTVPQEFAQGEAVESERSVEFDVEMESDIASDSQAGQNRAWLSIIHQLGQAENAPASRHDEVNKLAALFMV